jgi:RNA polymerase sigma-70 factor, ECF subfamily
MMRRRETIRVLPDNLSLVAQKRSDERIFDRVYRQYAADVLAYCRRRASRDVADEVTAETFLTVWRRLDDLPGEPLGWLLGIARLTLANAQRGSDRRVALLRRLQAQPLREASSFALEPTSFQETFNRLNDDDRETLLLAAWDGLSSREAAQTLGCTPVAYRLRFYRARRRLARALATEEVSVDPFVAKEEPT